MVHHTTDKKQSQLQEMKCGMPEYGIRVQVLEQRSLRKNEYITDEYDHVYAKHRKNLMSSVWTTSLKRKQERKGMLDMTARERSKEPKKETYERKMNKVMKCDCAPSVRDKGETLYIRLL